MDNQGSITGELEVARENRVVYRIGNPDPSLPKLIVVAAMHGNEPSGLEALLALEPVMRSAEGDMNGEIIGLIGNMNALHAGTRFVDQDLNRMWGTNNPPQKDSSESIEKEGLAAQIDRLLPGSGLRYILDLHTTSSDSIPFMNIADTDCNKAFASQFDMPSIIGIEKNIKGTLLEYISDLGHVGVAFEAGQHVSEQALYRHSEFILRSFHVSGILPLQGHDEVVGKQYTILYRHGITPTDGFQMLPGFANLTPVISGQVIATDHRGDVAVPMTGLLFMPLYQGEGEDGFFIVQEQDA